MQTQAVFDALYARNLCLPKHTACARKIRQLSQVPISRTTGQESATSPKPLFYRTANKATTRQERTPRGTQRHSQPPTPYPQRRVRRERRSTTLRNVLEAMRCSWKRSTDIRQNRF